ncbi:hypothetical protein VNI00_009268 [Paramarasmius palmivorus]|uniref:Uncharacterized protein n=1 Tax=Paramarasmius palmivorus TaxID=297713 RepID=A0AAW0CNX5_9AGAR
MQSLKRVGALSVKHAFHVSLFGVSGPGEIHLWWRLPNTVLQALKSPQIGPWSLKLLHESRITLSVPLQVSKADLESLPLFMFVGPRLADQDSAQGQTGSTQRSLQVLVGNGILQLVQSLSLMLLDQSPIPIASEDSDSTFHVLVAASWKQAVSRADLFDS